MSDDFLSRLGLECGTDKATWHEYTPFYDKLLSGKLAEYTKILELGIYRGESLRMWQEYFDKAKVTGLDWDQSVVDAARQLDPHISAFQVDCGSAQALNAWLTRAPAFPEFDLIVDDASHKKAHQTTALRTLWPHLNVGGTYIVEDAEVEGFHLDPPDMGVPHCVFRAKSGGVSVCYFKGW